MNWCCQFYWRPWIAQGYIKFIIVIFLFFEQVHAEKNFWPSKTVVFTSVNTEQYKETADSCDNASCRCSKMKLTSMLASIRSAEEQDFVNHKLLQLNVMICRWAVCYLWNTSCHSSMVSMAACYHWVSSFKSQQRR